MISRNLLALALCLCTVSYTVSCTPGRAGTSSPAAQLDSECALSTDPSVAMWRGSIIVRCQPGDAHDARCEASEVGPSGARSALDVGDAQGVWPLADGGMLVHGTEGQLDVIDAGGRRRVASWAADPEPTPDGRRVVYVAPPAGRESVDLGDPTRLVRLDLESGAVEVVWDEPHASRPIPLPGSDDVLAVSTHTGMASLYRVGADGALTQLTNLEGAAQGATPVPGVDWSLSPDGRRLYFSAGAVDESGPQVWVTDVGSGATEHVGPGRWVRATEAGADALIVREEDCRVRFGAGESP